MLVYLLGVTEHYMAFAFCLSHRCKYDTPAYLARSIFVHSLEGRVMRDVPIEVFVLFRLASHFRTLIYACLVCQ